ncbi:MAG: hypothetical protein SOZ08_06860 [Erysipelotrichaceae bacterium]|nr:hypothetical protein [Erysipelotrichaceae bacterium]
MRQENTKNQPTGKVTYKPTDAVVAVGISGILLLVFVHNLFGILSGSACIILASVSHFAIQDHAVMDVYQDHVDVYEPDDYAKTTMISNSDIVQWDVNRNHSYVLNLVLANGNRFSTMTYQAGKVQRLLMKTMPEKNVGIIQRNKAKKYRGKRKLW